MRALTWLSTEGVAEASTAGKRPRLAAHHGHVARLVVDAVVLLEALVVLLVDHDQAEIDVGQEQRRAGADDHARLAGCGCPPGAGALGRGQRRVPLDRRAAEAAREAVHELAGQRDLRQHDQRLAALLQRAGDGLEVDLRLARAGDAIEQRDGEGRRFDRSAHGVRGRRLVIAELDLGMGRVGTRIAPLGDRDLHQRAGRDQAVDHAGRAAGLGRERALGAHQAVGRRSPAPACAPASGAAVRRAPSTTRTPKRGRTGSNTAGLPIIMRTTMPSGVSV